MLSLETDFDLIHDLAPLFKDIVAEEETALQLSSPHGPKPTPPHPDAPPGDRGLTVVGVEKGYLLLAFDGYSKEKQTVATWIGLYDLRTGLHRVVYRHYAPIRVVNASLSEGGNLLACTYITIEVNTRESQEERYVTCLMELNQHGRVYYLCSSYGNFQRAQFIHSDPPKPSSPSASLSASSSSASFSTTSSPGRSPPSNTVKHFLLLFVHPDRIDLYTFVAGERQGQWRVLEQPKKGNAIVWKFKWAQWSSRNRTLYYLTTQDKDTYFLHARRFGSNPSDPSNAITYSRGDVFLPDETPDFLSANAANRSYNYHRCLRAVSDCHLDIELVRIPQTDDAHNARAALCLCRQIVSPTPREVWVVGLTFDEEDMQTEGREVRVRVPIEGKGDEEAAEAAEGGQMAEGRRRRAVLGRFAGMLAVYVPGSSFRLVDCSDCSRVLIMQGEDIKFGYPGIKISSTGTMFPIGDQHTLSEGICFFDTVTKAAHRARLSRDQVTIIRAAAHCDPRSLVCLFRIWARHVTGEEEVLTEIIRTMCARAVSQEYADVWKEYLIGTGFRAVVECCKDPDILAQLPFSTRKRKQISREIKRDSPPLPHLRPDPVSSPSLSEYGSLNPPLSRRPSHRRTTSQSGASAPLSPSVSVSVSQISAQGEFQRSLSRSGSSTPGTPPSPARKPVSLPARISGSSPSAWRPVSIPSLPSLMPSVSHSTPLSWRSAVSTQSPPVRPGSMSKEEQAVGYPRSPTVTSYFNSEIRRTPSGTKLDSFINIFFPTHTVVEGEVDTGRVGGRGSFQSASSTRRLSPPRRRTTLPGPLPSADSLVKRMIEEDDEKTVRQSLTDALVEVVSDHIIARRGFGDTQNIRVRTVEAVNAYVQSQIQQANHLWNTIDDTRRIPRISDFSTCRCWNCGPAHQHRRQQSSFTPPPFILSHSPSSFSESPRKIDTTTVPYPPTLRKTVAAAMARQDSDEGMFYFEPSDIEDDEEPPGRETIKLRRREVGAAVVLPAAAVVTMGIEPERQTWTRGAVSISREHLRVYKLLESIYRTLHDLGLPFPDGFHTAFVVLGFHTMTRRKFLQFVQQGVFRLTDTFMQHAVEVFSGSSDKEDIRFKMALVAELPSKNKMLRLQKQIPEYAPTLVVDQTLAAFFDSIPASTYQSTDPDNASFTLVDLLNQASSPGELQAVPADDDHQDEFLPFAAFCRNLKGKGYEDVAGVRNALRVVEMYGVKEKIYKK